MREVPSVYIALDHENPRDNIRSALELVKDSPSDDYGFKINIDSILNLSENGMKPYEYIKEIKIYGKPLFLDMKLWASPNPVTNIVNRSSELGIDIINIYPHFGTDFMKMVAKRLKGSETKLFCLTVLTHYTDKDTIELYGLDLKDTIKSFTDMSYKSGADGIILPGTQLDVVKDIPLLKLCPGIRPIWYDDKKDNYQEQVVTPSEAIVKGADSIIVGSPIMKSYDEIEALEKILSEVREARASIN